MVSIRLCDETEYLPGRWPRGARDVVLPRTFDQMVKQSDLIVEADAIGVHPSTVFPNDTLLATDVSFQIATILKGVSDSAKIVVAFPGGRTERVASIMTEFSPVEPGERYVLFLTKQVSSARRSILMDRPGSVRYEIAFGYVAFIRVVDSRLRLNEGSLRVRGPWTAYEGLPHAQLFADVQAVPAALSTK